MSSFLIPRVSVALGTLAAVAYLTLGTVAAAEPPSGTRVSLLPAGTRASVVIELDGELPTATAIEATDDQTVAVEIGPVRGKVVNQILRAAENSPLVKQVRVRGLTQGVEGTVVTILIEAKVPVSGSVRRATRRVYIDLEPRDVLSAGARTTTRPQAIDDPARPTPTSGQKPDTIPLRPTPPVAPPPPVRYPAPNSNRPTTAIADAQPARLHPAPPVEPARTAVTSPAASAPSRSTASAAVPSLQPGRAVASTSAGAVPPAAPVNESGPSVAVSAAAAPPSTDVPPSFPTAAAVPAADSMAATGSLEEIQRRAEQLTRVPDVKALQQLKSDVMARRDGLASVGAPTSDVNELLARFDQYVGEAQRSQLALDGSLFRGSQAPPAAKATAAPAPEPASSPRAQASTPTLPPAPQAPTNQSLVPTAGPAQEATLPAGPSQATPPVVPRSQVASSLPSVGPTPSPGRSSTSANAVGSALSIPAFRQALKPIKPDLESVAIALGSWSGGALPPANLQGVVASLIARLRAIQPPIEIASAHAGMCTALDALAIMWAKSMIEAQPEATEATVIERARSAVDEFMRAEGTLAPTTAAR